MMIMSSIITNHNINNNINNNNNAINITYNNVMTNIIIIIHNSINAIHRIAINIKN